MKDDKKIISNIIRYLAEIRIFCPRQDAEILKGCGMGQECAKEGIQNQKTSLILLSALVLLANLTSLTYGKGETPVSDGINIRITNSEAKSVIDGLIETVYDDPDWALAASDMILRENFCMDRWYDAVFNPCYPLKTRYWKLEPSADSGKAFTMSDLGVGTLDSLYIRQGYGFQLYANTIEPENPEDLIFASPYMCGPKYVSIDHWEKLAPHGFEQGTFFVSGGEGAISDYSIIVTRGCNLSKVSDINQGDCVVPGQEIIYTISYNTTELDDDNAVIIDYLPGKVDYNWSLPQGSYNSTEHTLIWELGTITPLMQGQIQVSVTVKNSVLPGNSIVNIVEMNGDYYFALAESRSPICYWAGNIIYVDKDAVSGLNNGTSWDNAFTDFNDALAQAPVYINDLGSCEIWVAAGTYKPTYKPPVEYYNATFRMPRGNVAIRGHFGGIGVYEISPEQRDFNNPAYETILDGRVGPGSWDKAQYTVTCADLGKGLILDGFTFTGASEAGLFIENYSDPSIIRCKFNGNSSYGIKAITFSYPDVSDCVFLENGTAGIYSDKSAWPYVKNCLFDGNYKNYYGLYGQYSDMFIENCNIRRQSYCGIYFSNSHLIAKNCNIENTSVGIILSGCPYIEIVGCSIKNNTVYGVECAWSNGKISDCLIEYNQSHGLYATNSYLGITGCNINNNNKDGIRIELASVPKINNNIIYKNKDRGIYADGAENASIKNNLIYLNGDNSSSGTDSGIYLKNSISPPVIRNNTVVSNPRYGIYVDYGRDPYLVNNIIWSNGINIYSLRGLAVIEAYYNCIEGGWSYGGTGNIDSDPCFRDASANDYHLKADSPCINSGEPNGDYDGETDIDGRKRVIYKRIDIGADEWANPPDYNLDGFVNFIDYSMFAQAWLTEDSDINLDEELIVDENDLFMFAECWAWSAYRSKADLNSDNIVNFRDFAMFANVWDEDFNALAQFCKDWLWVFTWD